MARHSGPEYDDVDMDFFDRASLEKDPTAVAIGERICPDCNMIHTKNQEECW